MGNTAENLHDRFPAITKDRKLSALNAGASLSALYVMGRDGITLASSNWTDETSFIGRDAVLAREEAL